ncbi:transporter [Bordetella pertussis]|nr:transporter [Bordetella pertussis]
MAAAVTGGGLALALLSWSRDRRNDANQRAPALAARACESGQM